MLSNGHFWTGNKLKKKKTEYPFFRIGETIGLLCRVFFLLFNEHTIIYYLMLYITHAYCNKVNIDKMTFFESEKVLRNE